LPDPRAAALAALSVESHAGTNSPSGMKAPPAQPEETTMHPTILNDLAQARTAELYRQADQARVAQAAKHARSAPWQHRMHRLLPRFRRRPVPTRTTA
jgi:poly-beta-hydroxyalkanoate depolymerase